MAARADDLLPVEYFHVVFTLPAEIARIAYWNKKAVYGLLFKASAQIVTTIAADPKRLGARVGLTSVLHTWGSALTHHPHILMVIPGGGLSKDGKRWVGCKPGFFLHVRVLSRLFRRLFTEGLLALHRAGKLAFFGDHANLANPDTFTTWLAPLRKSEWVVYAKPPFAGPEAVLAYSPYQRPHAGQTSDRHADASGPICSASKDHSHGLQANHCRATQRPKPHLTAPRCVGRYLRISDLSVGTMFRQGVMAEGSNDVWVAQSGALEPTGDADPARAAAQGRLTGTASNSATSRPSPRLPETWYACWRITSQRPFPAGRGSASAASRSVLMIDAARRC